MSRFVSLALLALLAALVLAPAAAADMHNDRMMDDGRMMEEQRMMEDDMMSTSMSSASASASAMSSASAMASPMSSASAMDGEMMSASATASASSLPGTGGTPLVPLLSALALALMGASGIVAARLVRRSS